ncbi:disulfide isomerase DsbC N-terminal domain-containing protein [Citrobacter freundii]|uniref:disulfide isomerase DsbC N-terminal domain-containing protein n=2 Tax=Citrobacter freundii TaxID=546 RepID=UPI0010057F25|nr:disulfide isomerase DsbC N-terminal domain-containing protein [Citrobacter freundii]MCT4736102.1 DsbC family protein [Citrobacter freundii]MDT7137359.1 disulfide isomerase DsbC N-terminal domain-containing protein [Citrobacter freundii]MDT7267423.1 disulfide isomerase DsbC N-terminal domain-containing protein [Citrobacter freundii]MDT7277051.1 disulfide isomerase DsbC N-terminal domain-containing protein [Citrobacter freundii]MDT7282172.1 disulfide isomerase DsbC N-terminal domain-containin
MRTKLLGALMVFGIITGTAHASSKLEITDPRAAKIEDIVELPIKGVRAVQSDGQIMFLSENGRFVISGQIYDLWSKKPLNTMSQMRDVAERIHFKSMGMDVDTLNTVSMGRGDKEVVVFVDPRCAVCHQLMGDAKSLVDDYTFKFIVIPALGAESNRLAKNGTVAKLAMRQPFVLFKGLTFQKLCLPGAFRPGDHHNKMLRPGLCVVHASPQYL